MERRAMTPHLIGTRQEWFAARLVLLEAEKELSRRSDDVATWHGGDFNFDFNVSFTEAQQREGAVDYNYERGGHAMDAAQVPAPVARFAAACGTDAPTYSRDRPGMSAFVREDGVIYHTYSTYPLLLDAPWR